MFDCYILLFIKSFIIKFVSHPLGDGWSLGEGEGESLNHKLVLGCPTALVNDFAQHSTAAMYSNSDYESVATAPNWKWLQPM